VSNNLVEAGGNGKNLFVSTTTCVGASIGIRREVCFIPCENFDPLDTSRTHEASVARDQDLRKHSSNAKSSTDLALIIALRSHVLKALLFGINAVSTQKKGKPWNAREWGAALCFSIMRRERRVRDMSNLPGEGCPEKTWPENNLETTWQPAGGPGGVAQSHVARAWHGGKTGNKRRPHGYRATRGLTTARQQRWLGQFAALAGVTVPLPLRCCCCCN